jgi:uncharacterized membrane protein
MNKENILPSIIIVFIIIMCIVFSRVKKHDKEKMPEVIITEDTIHAEVLRILNTQIRTKDNVGSIYHLQEKNKETFFHIYNDTSIHIIKREQK